MRADEVRPKGELLPMASLTLSVPILATLSLIQQSVELFGTEAPVTQSTMAVSMTNRKL